MSGCHVVWVGCFVGGGGGGGAKLGPHHESDTHVFVRLFLSCLCLSHNIQTSNQPLPRPPRSPHRVVSTSLSLPLVSLSCRLVPASHPCPHPAPHRKDSSLPPPNPFLPHHGRCHHQPHGLPPPSLGQPRRLRPQHTGHLPAGHQWRDWQDQFGRYVVRLSGGKEGGGCGATDLEVPGPKGTRTAQSPPSTPCIPPLPRRPHRVSDSLSQAWAVRRALCRSAYCMSPLLQGRRSSPPPIPSPTHAFPPPTVSAAYPTLFTPAGYAFAIW